MKTGVSKTDNQNGNVLNPGTGKERIDKTKMCLNVLKNFYITTCEHFSNKNSERELDNMYERL